MRGYHSMPKRLESPSSINTFKHCQRKYYYQYIEKLPTLPNIHQIRGNIAHSTLENFYDIDVSLWTKENVAQKIQSAIQTLFFHYWQHYKPELQKLPLSKDQERFYFEETMLMLMNWASQFTQEVRTALEKNNCAVPEAFLLLTPIREQKFVSDHYSVQGFIDAIHQVEEEVHIIDYKTNASLELKDEQKLQLAIYSLLYFEKHGKKPSKVGIFFLRHKLKTLKVDEELLELAKREISLVHAHTSGCDHIHDYPQKPGPLCKWSSGQCDFYGVCKPFEGRNGK